MKQIPKDVLLKSLVLCLVLVAGGLLWRQALVTGQLPWAAPKIAALGGTLHPPYFEFLKLVAAFLVGVTLTVFHRLTGHDPAFGVSMEHAQILLCVAGALMMIIIGDSLARAFGIAGAASIIRFRTPVEDPKDTIILFLSLGLGMACGLGAFALVGLGTAFLCGVMVYLSGTEQKPKRMILALKAAESEFPTAQVQAVLSRHGIRFETREVAGGPEASVKYHVLVGAGVPLDKVSEDLQEEGGVQSVVWETPKKKG